MVAPVVHRRSWGRTFAGVLLLVAGVAALVVGIALIFLMHQRVYDASVGRGVVIPQSTTISVTGLEGLDLEQFDLEGFGIEGLEDLITAEIERELGTEVVRDGGVATDAPRGAVAFRAPGGEGSTYTIWLTLPGMADEDVASATVRSVTCQAQLADGSTERLAGNNRDAAIALNDLHTVGSFDAPAGPAAVTCSSPQANAQGQTFLVALGRPDALPLGFGLVAGGILVGVIGIFVLVGGLRRRLVPA